MNKKYYIKEIKKIEKRMKQLEKLKNNKILANFITNDEIESILTIYIYEIEDIERYNLGRD